MARVLRTLRGLALLAVVATGCGGASPERAASRGVPRALAQAWAGQANAIATAAAAGNDCRARRLAASLRADVRSSAHSLPLRLRSPLLTDVTSLADRISCTPVTTEPTPLAKNPKPPKEPKPKPPKHGHPGDDTGHKGHKGHDKGHGG